MSKATGWAQAVRSEMPIKSLLDQIRPQHDYLRAAHLERHQDQVEHYIPTGRALEVLRRLLNAVNNPTAGRAWSLTGPYGAGKSSFALFLHSLFGPAGNRRDHADHALREADSGLLGAVVDAHAALKSTAQGFVLATTTCQSEPLTESVLRALTRGSHAYWPRAIPLNVKAALNAARVDRTARSIADAVEAFAVHAPVLIILDEFGKTLEHIAGTSGSIGSNATDLFALQEIAERASGLGAVPAFLFTLQHLAFDDYVRRASAVQRREWGKVQGRFEDISFLETPEQSLRLVSGAFDDTDITPALDKKRQYWATHAHKQIAQLGLASHVPGGAKTLARCYPLHPTALVALPELCARLGQHGRTLFTFLSSTEPHTASDFLARTPSTPNTISLPVIALSHLYDFFAGPGHALANGVGGSRWREIDERIREADGLELPDLACLKTVGLLNLLGHVAGLRASADLVAYSLGPPDKPVHQQWRNRLDDLEGRGWVTYRAFADEYRLWQGSDVDLRSRVSDAREQLRSTSPAELLTRLQDSPPRIAGRHSQRVGMLRYFSVSYADDSTKEIPALGPGDPADGALVYYLGDPITAASLHGPGGGRPIVLAVSEAVSRVRDAVIEAAAALAVLDQQDVFDDRVARRELQDRIADTRSRLTDALAESFRPGAHGVRWQLLNSEGSEEVLSAGKGLSRLLSEICDKVYGQSPVIRNEMLGRRELTSQGAKARRNLLEAMIYSQHEEKLALKGFGPERAMYDAVLHHTGIHSQDDQGMWRFTQPNPGRLLGSVWGVMAQCINPTVREAVGVDKLYARLMAPPVGLKEGPIPVLLAAFLLHRHDDVAIYEDGTYQPTLTPDLLERLLKTPHRFALKAFNTAGTRAKFLAVISALTAELEGQPTRGLTAYKFRNSTVLAAAAPLINFARALPEYTKSTTTLSPRALAVRAVLLTAREPDAFLFRDLPVACDLMPLSNDRGGAEKDVALFTNRLREALGELQDSYSVRLARIGEALAVELNLSKTVSRLRAGLSVRAETLEGKVLDPKLRAFLYNASDIGLDDESWLEALGLAVADRPPAAWRDDDAARFQTNLQALVAAFRRVEALHFEAAAVATTEGFTASRLTLTAPDGHESSRVVYVDDASREKLERVAKDALLSATAQAGPQGCDALLALVADLVLATPTTGSVSPRRSLGRHTSTDTKEAMHG
jgi:hypothetical protein